MQRVLLSGIVGLLMTAALSSMASAVEVTRQRPVVARGDDRSYIGVAITKTGRVFELRDMADAVDARNDARNECEHAGDGLCNAISVDMAKDVIGVACRDGNRRGGYLGANGQLTARRNALNKANDDGFLDRQCSEAYSY